MFETVSGPFRDYLAKMKARIPSISNERAKELVTNDYNELVAIYNLIEIYAESAEKRYEGEKLRRIIAEAYHKLLEKEMNDILSISAKDSDMAFDLILEIKRKRIEKIH